MYFTLKDSDICECGRDIYVCLNSDECRFIGCLSKTDETLEGILKYVYMTMLDVKKSLVAFNSFLDIILTSLNF